MKKVLFVIFLVWASVASAVTLPPVQLLNPASSSSGQAIISTGASSAPAWSSSINASQLSGNSIGTVRVRRVR